MSRSSLGSGRGRAGFSDPADPVCFLSSALGWYVPAMLLFFLITHSSSRSRLSRDSTVQTKAETVGVISVCIAVVTDSCGVNTHTHTHTQACQRGQLMHGLNLNHC